MLAVRIYLKTDLTNSVLQATERKQCCTVGVSMASGFIRFLWFVVYDGSLMKCYGLCLEHFD